MHPFKHARRLLLGGFVAVAGVGGTVQPAAAQPAAPPGQAAPAAKPPEVRVGRSGELIVPLGGQVIFLPKTGNKLVKTVQVEKDSVLRVAKTDDPNAQLLTGLNPGLTRITVVLNDDSTAEFEVLVQPDYDLLRRVIQAAVPTASVNVVPGVGNSIVLTGYVNKPEDAATVVRIAQGGGGTGGAAAAGGGGGAAGAPAAGVTVIDAIQVGGPQHVQIEVVIAQVDRTELRQRGADFSINGRTVNFDSLISGLITSSPTSGIPGVANIPTGSAANLRLGVAPAGFLGALQALKTEGLAKFLSEPKVVTQSGRPAFIRSGGQQAVLAANGGFGGVSVTLEQIGTSMEVVPIVLGQGKIYLEVFPTVRTRNDGNGVATSFGFSPGFSEQSTRAAVTLESGQTYAIGGLLETSLQNTTRKVPVVGELPFVGPAFSQISSDMRERELIILVTPRLVDAMDCAQVPRRMPGQETRNADDYELFLEGLLEAPRGQRQVWNGKCYNAAYKCDPTYGLFPCRGNVCAGGPVGGAGCGPAGCGTTTAVPHGVPAALPPIAPVPVAPAAAVTPAAAQQPPAPPPTPEPGPLPPVDPVNVPSLPPVPTGEEK